MREMTLGCIVLVAVGISVPLGVAMDCKMPLQVEPRRSTYLLVLDEAMPTATQSLSSAQIWQLTIRILPPHGEPELLITMTKSYDGSVVLTLLKPNGKSISAQVRHLEQENVPVAQMAARLAISRRSVSSAAYPRLVAFANSFETLRVMAIPLSPLFVDGTGYTVSSHGQFGNRMKLELEGPGRKAKKQPDPLLEWVEQLRKYVEQTFDSGDSRPKGGWPTQTPSIL